MTFATLSNLQKKLLFRAWHRGTRESDLLLGRFAEAHVPGMDDAQLNLFAALLNEQDPDIYDWLVGRAPVPDPFKNIVMDTLCNFYAMPNPPPNQPPDTPEQTA